MVEFKS